jgi:alkylation response protein AidB-like acyl-CoA dehydrogenase
MDVDSCPSLPDGFVGEWKRCAVADAEFLTALRSSAASVQDKLCSIDRVRRLIDSNEVLDRNLWAQAAELGWLALAIPEAYGGMDAGIGAVGVLQEVLGAHLAPIPFIGTAVFSLALAAWPHEQVKAGLFRDIAAGDLVGGVADFDAAPPLRLTDRSDTYQLDGATAVIDGAAANWILVRVVTADQTEGLALLAAETRGVRWVPRPIADATRSLITLSCNGAPVEAAHLFLGAGAGSLLRRLTQATALLLACDCAGGAEAIFAETVEYLRTRIQFGKPIGSFQALKHRAADLKVNIEVAREIVLAAIECAEGEDLETWAPMAKFIAGETYMQVASEAMQMHGAIGYSWEHRAHLYLKRATLNVALLGGRSLQEDRLADMLLIAEAD